MPAIDNSLKEQTEPMVSDSTTIELLTQTFFLGCNPYYRCSVIRQSVSFGDLADINTIQLGNRFKKDFLSQFMGLKSFLPRNGLDKKFIKQLKSSRGADLKVTLLEAILAIEAATSFARHELNSVRFAGLKIFEKHVDLIWESQTPKLSEAITNVALQGLLELLPSEFNNSNEYTSSDFKTNLKSLLKKARRSRMAASTAVVKYEASTRGIPCEIVGQQHLIVGQGNKQKHLYASMTSTTPITAQKICADKRQTNRRLRELRLPVPKHSRVGTAEDAVQTAKSLGLPVIIKPVKGKKGKDISDKITTLEAVPSAFDVAHSAGSDVLVEKFIEGDDYRLLVIDGNFHSGLRRKPPTIIGDGKSTVAELIMKLNKDPYRDRFRGFPVSLDNEVNDRLEQAGVKLEDILLEGQAIVLRMRANVSTGGTPTDVTDLVHPKIRSMAERAAKAVGLTVAGIDYMTTDIERSPKDTNGVIIEVNARPGLDIHVWPHAGKSRDAGGALLDHLFPDKGDGRIPIIVAAGDQGTGTSARLVEALMRGTGRHVALTLRSAAYANGSNTSLSTKQRAYAPLVLMRDPEIDTLVSTVSLRQTAKRGMLVDHCDVAMIMDRIKPGGVKAFLAGLDVVIQATTGCIVVSAANLVALQRIDILNKTSKLIVVSPQRDDPAFQAHLAAGRVGVTTVWQDGSQCILLLSGDEVILTLSEAFFGNEKNSREGKIDTAILFAVAAAYGAGLNHGVIKETVAKLPELVIRPSSSK
jgi:cyanophycin synthetase